MGVVIVLCSLLVTIAAFEVNITGEWKPELGWEVTCLWETQTDDALQSVRLYNNGQQFMIYRPEIHGPARTNLLRAPEKVLNIDCSVITYRGRKGKCTIILEPYQPPLEDFTFTCEVSGERPMFRITKKDYLVKVVVPPSKAQLTSTVQEQSSATLVTLNCSTDGLPAPSLKWSIGDDKIQEVFSGRVWNVTSKLWHVWSYFTYTRSDKNAIVSCTPEVTHNNETVTGAPAMFNSALRLCGTLTIMAAVICTSLIR